jgi:tRNA threonylcarbamoyl adenosine modification protein (Sua5/YciO/YrdC/YwlC family)
MVYNNIMPGILRLEEGRESAVAEACAKALSGGAVAIVPTDTVYGVAASVRVPRAVRRVYAVKGRDAAKPLVVMTASVEEAVALAVPRERESVRRLASFWPGALTVVVEAVELPWREVVAPGSRTLGIRVPDCPFLLEVLSLAGPLAVTSATPSGGEAPVRRAGSRSAVRRPALGTPPGRHRRRVGESPRGETAFRRPGRPSHGSA